MIIAIYCVPISVEDSFLLFISAFRLYEAALMLLTRPNLYKKKIPEEITLKVIGDLKINENCSHFRPLLASMCA